MGKFTLSEQAYCKALLHAAKYPALPVCGVFVAAAGGDATAIVDALPLFHSHALAPMQEAAMLHVDEHCALGGLRIVGAYSANERNDEVGLSAGAKRLVGKLTKTLGSEGCGVVALVANEALDVGDRLAMTAIMPNDAAIAPAGGATAADFQGAFHAHLLAARERRLADFEGHTDNVAADWRNTALFR